MGFIYDQYIDLALLPALQKVLLQLPQPLRFTDRYLGDAEIEHGQVPVSKAQRLTGTSAMPKSSMASSRNSSRVSVGLRMTLGCTLSLGSFCSTHASRVVFPDRSEEHTSELQ